MSFFYIPLTSIVALRDLVDQDFNNLNTHYLRIHWQKYRLSGQMIVEKEIFKKCQWFFNESQLFLLISFTKLNPFYPSMLVVQIDQVVLWKNVKQLRTEWRRKKVGKTFFVALPLILFKGSLPFQVYYYCRRCNSITVTLLKHWVVLSSFQFLNVYRNLM